MAPHPAGMLLDGHQYTLTEVVFLNLYACGLAVRSSATGPVGSREFCTVNQLPERGVTDPWLPTNSVRHLESALGTGTINGI